MRTSSDLLSCLFLTSFSRFSFPFPFAIVLAFGQVFLFVRGFWGLGAENRFEGFPGIFG